MNTSMLWQDAGTLAGSLTLSHKRPSAENFYLHKCQHRLSCFQLEPYPTYPVLNKQTAQTRCWGWDLLHKGIKSLSQIAADLIAEALGVSPLPRIPSQGKQIEKPKSNVFSRTRPWGGRERPLLSTLSPSCYFLSQDKASPREVNLPWIEQGHSLRYRASCGLGAPRPSFLGLMRPQGPRGSG